MATGYPLCSNNPGTTGQILTSNGSSSPATWQNPSGGIGGTVAANQVAYGSGTNAIQGNANLTFNGSTLSSLGGDAATPALVTRGDVSLFTNSGNPTPYRTFAFEPDNSELVIEYDSALAAYFRCSLYPDQVLFSDFGADSTMTNTVAAVNIITDGAGFAGVSVTVDGTAYTAATIRSQGPAAAPVPQPLNLSIGELQINGSAGISNQFLKSVGPGGAPVWSSGTNAAPPRVYTVGIDNPTIQGCINLCTSPSSTNAYIIRIPPGTYNENLTLKGSVQLQGMTNPGDTTTVNVVGTHTLNGAAVNPLDNRVTISNVVFSSNSSAVTATFTFTATTATQVNFFGCFFQNTNVATTSKILSIGSLVNCYLTNVVSRMASTAGQGGTHFTVTGGLYSGSGVDVDGGTRCIDVLAGGYTQIAGGQFYCSSGVGGEAVRVAAGATIAAGYCAFKNSASAANNAHGVNLLGVNAVMYATWVTFDVLNGASGYVVNGPANSVYVSTACQYSNIPGLLTRNVKIKNTVTAAAFTTTLVSSP